MIRLAKQEDIPSLKLIATLAWQQAYGELIPDAVQEEFLESNYSEAAIQARFESSECIVALEDDYIVGFANYGTHEDHVHLYGLYVLPTIQKEGIGTELLDAVVAYSKGHGDLIILELENGNYIGEAFYKSKGFEIVEYRPDELQGHPIKTIVMKLSLKDA